jgi:nucleotide-binding universal stress UspA family protein
MIVLNKILVATDFSEASDAALAYGRALATAFRASLDVLHVTENLYLYPGSGTETYVGIPPEAQNDIERAAKKQAEALLTDEDWIDRRAKVVTITSNTPAAMIVRYAKTEQVDLIVLGTHGRGVVAQIFMGSVAEKVVRTAPCPVLTVRHPQHEFVRPDALVAVSQQFTNV